MNNNNQYTGSIRVRESKVAFPAPTTANTTLPVSTKLLKQAVADTTIGITLTIISRMDTTVAIIKSINLVTGSPSFGLELYITTDCE